MARDGLISKRPRIYDDLNFIWCAEGITQNVVTSIRELATWVGRTWFKFREASLSQRTKQPARLVVEPPCQRFEIAAIKQHRTGRKQRTIWAIVGLLGERHHETIIC